MDYLLVGCIVLFLLFIFNVLGKLLNSYLGLSFKFNIPLGYILSLGISQIVGFVLITLKTSIEIFILTYVGILGLFFALLVIFYRKRNEKLGSLLLIDNTLPKGQQWKSIILILFGVMFIYCCIMKSYTIDGMSDSSFYIPHILENVSTTHIYGINPWSGLNESFNSLYLYVTYELFHSMIIRIFSLHGLLYINHGISIINFIVIIMSFSELASKIFKSYKSYLFVSLWLFIIFIFVTKVDDNFFFFFSTGMIIKLPYTGKVLGYLAFIPLFYSYLMEFLENKSKQKEISFILLLLNLALMALTSTGVFIFGIEYIAIIFFLLWSKEFNFDEVTLLSLSTFPLLLFVVIVQYPALTPFVIIAYALLYLVYRLNIKFVYYLMRYGLLLLTIMIPLVSILLYSLSKTREISLFAPEEFIQRLIQSLSLNMVLVCVGSIIGLIMYLKDKSTDKIGHLLFGLVPIYLLIVFINPISCTFVATFLTTSSVYHRLFYILPFYPLTGICMIRVGDLVKSKFINQPVFKMMFAGLGALIIYQFYQDINTVFSNRLLNENFSYKNMVWSDAYDNAQLLNEYIAESATVIVGPNNLQWADELRSIRSLVPKIILPYNTSIHRSITAGDYTNEEGYKGYQLTRLINGIIKLEDFFVEKDNSKSNLTNKEVLIPYLINNFDYILFPINKDNKEFLFYLFKEKTSVIAKNNQYYLIDLREIKTH